MSKSISERLRTLRGLVRALVQIEAGVGHSDEWYAGWADCWDKVHGAIEAQPEGDRAYTNYRRSAAEDQR